MSEFRYVQERIKHPIFIMQKVSVIILALYYEITFGSRTLKDIMICATTWELIIIFLLITFALWSILDDLSFFIWINKKLKQNIED